MSCLNVSERNATKRARRSDSLFRDNISRRELCNMIARLEEEVEALRKQREEK